MSSVSQLSAQLKHPTSIIALAFAGAIAIGTGVLSLPAAQAQGQAAGFMTALFTATSAICVTGLVVVDTGSYWSGFGQAAILVMFQLGGIGMMASAALLALVINRQLGLGSRRVLQAETHALNLGDARSVAKLILAVTLVVEAVTTAALALRFAIGHGMAWPEALWQGLFHAVSAFNNAGFSTWGDSVMRYAEDAWVLGPLMAAIIIGGLGFPVLHELLLRRRTRCRASMHMVLTLWGSAFLVVAGAVGLYLAESGNPRTLGPLGGAQQVLGALFASVSARTAGFNALDIGALNTESLALHYALMFIGGGSAGTAGGVKVTTFFVLLLVVWNEVRGHADVEFRGRRIAPTVQRQAVTMLVLSAGVITAAVLALQPMTGLPFEKVVFEVISAFATVGLSTGITAELPPAGHAILVALMFTGRIGVVTLAAALAMNHGRRPYRYPEEKPLVG